MKPPKVYEVTMPSSQRMIKITAIVYSMTKSLFKVCNQFTPVYEALAGTRIFIKTENHSPANGLLQLQISIYIPNCAFA